ncbi:hypothetical protein B0H11DRAFT_1973891 [Mycena galericulata]|nr:hypothetical protein B0H11DRAFT_1973891 [Mycena galericulata]
MHPLGAGCHRAGGIGAGATHPTSTLIFTVLRRSCPASAARPTQELATWPGVFHYAYALFYHLCHPLLLSFTSGTVDPSLSAHPNGTSQPISHQYIQVHALPTNLDLIASRASSFDEDLRVGTCAFTQRTACGRTRWEIHYQHTYACGTYVIWALLRLSPASGGGGGGAMHYQHTYTVGLSQIPSTSKVAT